jgi:hypothetical protein
MSYIEYKRNYKNHDSCVIFFSSTSYRPARALSDIYKYREGVSCHYMETHETAYTFFRRRTAYLTRYIAYIHILWSWTVGHE